MHISSPFVVVPIIIAVFTACILWATGANAEGHQPSGDLPDHKSH
jgi:hypothetical protein